MESKDSSNPGTNLSPAQMWHHYRRYPYLLAKTCLFALVVAILFFVVRSVEAVLFPLLASLLIAYLLDPAVDWFEARKVSRPIAISIFMFAGLVGAALVVLVLYPTVARTGAMIIDQLPQLADVIQTQTLPWLREQGVEVPPTLSEAFEEYGAQLQASLPSMAQRLSGWIAGIVTGAGGVIASLLNVVMIPIFTFYFLRDFDRMTAAVSHFVPKPRRELLLDRAAKADEVVGAWFRGQVEVAIILGSLYAIGLGGLFGSIGIGVMSGVAIGILSGVLNIVPYFGVLIGLIMSALLVLIDWHGWIGPIGVAVVFAVIQLLEGYVITPKIVGEKVGLSPVTVIIVLLLGSELFGLVGILLAIPVSGVIRVLLPDILSLYTNSAFYTGQLAYNSDQTASVLSNELETRDGEGAEVVKEASHQIEEDSKPAETTSAEVPADLDEVPAVAKVQTGDEPQEPKKPDAPPTASEKATDDLSEHDSEA